MLARYVYAMLLGIGFALDANLTLADATKKDRLEDYLSLSLVELGNIKVSIATGNGTPLDKAPSTATVINAAEIEAMGARNLDEVLETVPGLHISLSSLSRLDAVYSIRGIHTELSSGVLLLLNGVPVQSAIQGGRPTLFRLPVVSIERVEVIRGPGSAIYGADAYAGVINVITKTAQTVSDSEIGVRSGSFNTHDVWAQGVTDWRGMGIAFDMSYQETDGDPDRIIHSDQQSILDAALNTNASLAPGSLSTRYKVLDTHLALNNDQAQVNLWNWLTTDTGIGAGAVQALDPVGKDDNSLWMADVTYHLNPVPDQSGNSFDNSPWDNSVRLSYLYVDLQAKLKIFPPGAVLPIGNDGNVNVTAPAGFVQFPDGLIGSPGSISKTARVDFISLFNGWDAHRDRVAVGMGDQRVTARERKNFGPGVIDGSIPVIDGTLHSVTDTQYVYLEDSSRQLQYFSLQDEWQIGDDVALTTGVRYDHYSDVGGTTNPRIALVWSTTEKLTTKLLYGSAFRAPSFSELYIKNNPVSLGNTDLKPERIRTLETAFNYHITETLQTTLTLFAYEARDMIDFVADANATTETAQNIHDLSGRGFEFEVNWQIVPQFRMNTSYSWQDARYCETRVQVADAPGEQLKMNANWEFASNWFLNTQVNWIADRQRAYTDVRPAIDNYTLVNLTFHRKNIYPGLDAALALRNATDEDAREPSAGSATPVSIPEDYPLQSRSVWLEFKYTFQ